VDENATLVYANSTKTTYIYPREWIDLLPRAFNDILLPVNASTPGQWTLRYDETDDMFLTKEKEFPHATNNDTRRAMAFTIRPRTRRSK
jgi:hypothetical protein